ncbi:hypothetical protein T10_3582 [Trichinella papuae]|uniref:Uncharacterized protein n=1 Tax=Trichinella papuae TaxID=268474 RepID=A0A0V1MIP4_9BILA|nr:hypothetical protein T10_3582 [Trichinella papuae]
MIHLSEFEKAFSCSDFDENELIRNHDSLFGGMSFDAFVNRISQCKVDAQDSTPDQSESTFLGNQHSKQHSVSLLDNK